MPSVEFATVTEARAGFKAMFEAAQNGGAGLVHRDGHRFALVDADRIADALHAALPITPEVYFEEDVVGLALPGAPFAAEGNDLEEAAEEMIEALREYAQDWKSSVTRLITRTCLFWSFSSLSVRTRSSKLG